MEQFDIETVTKRSVRGIFALVSRTFIIQIIGIAASFLLTIFLDPNVFGVFFVVSAVIAFLSYFSDIGLAAALIQKKEEITKEDLKTTFTIQQILVGVVVIIALLSSSVVGSFYKLETPGILLFQALVISFFISSIKTIPSIILERSLRFEKLVIPQILETLVYNIVAVILAILDFGITSFTFAVLARGIIGLIAIYIIQPWHIQIGFSVRSAKKLLSYGIPFQANSFLALLKDDLILLYLGKVLPLAQIGYIGFAKKWAFMPLRLIMDNAIRITFPSFSRLQHDKKSLSIGIEKSLFAGTLVILPLLTGLVILSPYLINFIPEYSKWNPALLSLSIFAIDGALSSISTPLTNALNAIGKIKITLYLMIFWTIATWIMTPIAIIFLGFNGFAVSSAIISSSLFVVIYLVKKYIDFKIIRVIIYPFISTLIMGSAVYILSPLIVRDIFSLIGVVFFGGILYLSLLFLFAKREIISNINLVKKSLAK